MSQSRHAYTRLVLGARDEVLDGILRHSLLEARMRTIQVDDDTGRVLQLLTLMHRPSRVIEIGTLFGYSTVYIARGLPPNGQLTTLEIDPVAVELAQTNIQAAGLVNKVTVLGIDAIDYLRDVPDGSIDMVFIDGAKKQYPEYLKHAYKALRRGGILVADDVFGDGDYREESQAQSDSIEEISAIDTYARAVGRSQFLFSAFLFNGNGLLVSIKV